MKVCSRCKASKSFSGFSKKRNGLNSWCKECINTYCREHYKNNIDYYVEKAKKHTEKLKKRLYTFLQTQKCIDCGETDWIVLEFDHRDPKKKSGRIMSILTSTGSWGRVEKEIEKCDIRCANCHRRKTAKQFNHYTYLK